MRPRQNDWVVYATRPFGGPHQVFDDVGRYTHRAAIANERLLTIDDGHVTCRDTGYRANGADRQTTMTLEPREFIRRFLLHVLPPGFHRIRYYGVFGNRHRAARLAHCRRLLGMPVPLVPLAPPPACSPFTSPSEAPPQTVETCHRGSASLVSSVCLPALRAGETS